MSATTQPHESPLDRFFGPARGTAGVSCVGRRCDVWPRLGWLSSGFAVLVTLVMLSLMFASRSGESQTNPPTSFRVTQTTAGEVSTGADFVQGDYWALIIGINEYPNLPPSKQLLAAKPGAEAVMRVLRQRYGFAREQIRVLYDGQATRGGVLRQVRALKDVGSADSVFIYYAGHCQAEPISKEVWWIPADAQEDDITTYISLTDMQSLWRKAFRRDLWSEEYLGNARKGAELDKGDFPLHGLPGQASTR